MVRERKVERTCFCLLRRRGYWAESFLRFGPVEGSCGTFPSRNGGDDFFYQRQGAVVLVRKGIQEFKKWKAACPKFESHES